MTDYVKEPYHVEKKFPVTVYDKQPYQVEVKVPYIVEHQVPYLAQIQIPYEVTHIEEGVVYEIEEYTVSQEVPYVIEIPTVSHGLDHDIVTTTHKEELVHEHPVLHDEHFGEDALGIDGLSGHGLHGSLGLDGRLDGRLGLGSLGLGNLGLGHGLDLY